ncbi:HD domain-containing protein [Iodobacter sp. HSC-16F04]|uniref:HD domain-containing protein n=1 Tax=Iodobacter violaceini TaxID=3044271 RepID=A0ABX0KLV3_9NEIS|nr:HD domain-containing phosphohydrolase [Iodobacter violacea]NHQ85193.1 HD domain-containing protein [Iodobacter violacea]
MQNAIPQFLELGPSAKNMTESVETIHKVISSRYPGVDRVAMAIYDAASDTLKTFVSSNHDGVALAAYEAKLQDVPSLKALASARQSRVVQDISNSFPVCTEHTDWLKGMGYLSSYTVPVYQRDELAGFIFFDSKSDRFFTEESARFLDIFTGLIAQLYLLQLTAVRSLIGTVHIASDLAKVRDLETGNHLERMASYSRIIAKELAHSHSLPDEFVEYVYLFAPLHDIGKVGIPDRILFKPGQLNDEEWLIMRRHVEMGENLIDQIISALGMAENMSTSVMRNMVAAHHERGDGSGYPRGLLMADIPLEARIVAVADVFDALTNVRPYKLSWSEERVWAELEHEAALGRLDAECVNALRGAEQERRHIQDRFADE